MLYNWIKRETLSPHTWVTDYMNDLALPVNFVGLSTEDRRFIYPQKEVMDSQAVRMHKAALLIVLRIVCDQKPPGTQ